MSTSLSIHASLAAPAEADAAGLPEASAANRTHGNALFWRLLRQATWWAAALHVLFLALFLWLDASMLAMGNVASLVVLTASAWMQRQQKYRPAAYMVLAEVLCHAGLAVIGIGWDSGFHYYVLAVVPTLFVSRELKSNAKWTLAGAVVTYYGVLRLVSYWAQPLHEQQAMVLHVLEYFNIVAVALLLAHLSAVYFRLVTDAEQRLHRLATIDPLTNLANRRRWLDHARLAESLRSRRPFELSLVLCDVDEFKKINNRLGHEAGDEVLVKLSRILQESLRATDSVARWGGEEFIILLPGAALPQAFQVAETLRQRVAALNLSGLQALTMTFGVCEVAAGEPISSAIRRADGALHRGKLSGRNQVVSAAAPAPVSDAGEAPDDAAATASD
jgi:diguanylate cyclase (GGDEF)-like protein